MNSLTIEELVRESHETAVSKGWWEGERNVGEAIALMHSELSEALEEYRKGVPLGAYDYVDGKPEGFVVELADAIIRIADLCGRHNLSLELALLEKMEYNRTRPYRHGGKIA